MGRQLAHEGVIMDPEEICKIRSGQKKWVALYGPSSKAMVQFMMGMVSLGMG